MPKDVLERETPSGVRTSGEEGTQGWPKRDAAMDPDQPPPSFGVSVGWQLRRWGRGRNFDEVLPIDQLR
jgi:hypothetical protein